MDIRLEVLEINGIWNVTDSGPKPTPFSSQSAALAAGIRAARKHHQDTGGSATVHLWSGKKEILVFDTRLDDGRLESSS